jgi:hypothetical protein
MTVLVVNTDMYPHVPCEQFLVRGQRKKKTTMEYCMKADVFFSKTSKNGGIAGKKSRR